MEARLVPHEGGWALPVDQALLDLLEASGATAFTLEVRDGALVAEPVATGPVEPTIEEAVKRRERFEAALALVNERFAGAFARLGARS